MSINSTRCLLITLMLFSKMAVATCLGLGCTCGISATAINFGNYVPVNTSPTNGTGNVAITCSALVIGLLISYEIQLSTGGSGTYSPRFMANGVNHLNYNIYANSGRTQIWGNNTGGTVSVTDSYLLNISPTTLNYTTYGQIPASQNVPPGSYSDTITATVIF